MMFNTTGHNIKQQSTLPLTMGEKNLRYHPYVPDGMCKHLGLGASCVAILCEIQYPENTNLGKCG